MKQLVMTAGLILVLTGIVQATLVVRGSGSIVGGDGSLYQLIYDKEQNITWLDFTYDGTWTSTLAWAENLEVCFQRQIYDNWRLPVMDESCLTLGGGWGYHGPDENGYYDYEYGYYMVNSEMGHLYYETLGNNGLYRTDGTYDEGNAGLQNTGPFENIWRRAKDWLGNQYSPNTDRSWLFHLEHGGMVHHSNEDISLYAMVVHPGDVPEPATMLLLGTGLVGLAGFRKKFKK